MGEFSALYRFSYQVVLTTRVVVSEITGELGWPSECFARRHRARLAYREFSPSRRTRGP